MIEGRELRIGNKVLFASESIEFEVLDISIDGVGLKNDEEITWIEIESIEGIPLTEEWLVKLGFEESYKSSFRHNFDHIKHTEVGYNFSKVSDKSMEGCRYFGHYIKLKYVHQLQNLFFALTGEELTLQA